MHIESISLQVSNTMKCYFTELAWSRIYLELKFSISNAKGVIRIIAVDVRTSLPCAPLNVERLIDGSYHAILNMTNSGHQRCIPPGSYRFFAIDESMQWCEGQVDLLQLNNNSELTRTFPYSNHMRAYQANFVIEENSGRYASLELHIIEMKNITTRSEYNFTRVIQNHRTANSLMTIHKRGVLRLAYSILRKHRRNNSRKPTVLFLTEQSDQIGSNLLAVRNRMFERGLDADFNIMEVCHPARSNSPTSPNLTQVVRMLAKADWVFYDNYVPTLNWLVLDSSTTVIQLWHAGGGFKSSGYARWGIDGAPKPFCCYRQSDWCISGSRRISEFFSEVMGINPEQVVPTGMPRMDAFLDPEHAKEVRESLIASYPLCKGKKVILFAPTYRGKGRKTAYYPYELIDFDKLYQICGDEWVVLFKMHPWVPTRVPLHEEHLERFVDVGDYPDINDLFHITDLLITDYSSCVYEFSLLGKPMLFYAFDEEAYSLSRGFHRSYRGNAPGKVCSSFDELLDSISLGDFEQWRIARYVEENFDQVDTHASDRVIDWFLLGKMPEEFLQAVERKRLELEFTASLHFLDHN